MESKLKKYESRAAMIKALAHPARLLVIDKLSKGETCVCELTKLIGSDISTVSKHLLVLRNAGIVNTEKRGLQVFYSLNCPCVIDFLECSERAVRNSRRGKGG